MGWETMSYSFTATTTGTTSLSFTSNTPGPYGPALDNVSVVAPEPASLVMSGMALLTVTGVALRRRKARVAQA